MTQRHVRVVLICLAALLVASLGFMLCVPVAVQRTAYGDNPDLSRALTSPELQAWQRRKSQKLVDIAEIYAALELGDREVQERFPSLSHPVEGNSPALGSSTDPVEILEESIRLDPDNLSAATFLAELCLHRDARGVLSGSRQAWLLGMLARVSGATQDERLLPHAITLAKVTEQLLEKSPPDRMAEVRAWWTDHGAELRALAEGAGASRY